MTNELKMAIVDSILALHAAHWSARRIAGKLKIDRGTVNKYLQQAKANSKPAISPAGSEGSKPATFPPVPGTLAAGNGCVDSATPVANSKPAISPPGATGDFSSDFLPDFQSDGAVPAADTTAATAVEKRGRPNACLPYAAVIQEKLDLGLSAQRIYQDLVSEHGFASSYDSVKRFVRQQGHDRPLPFRRIERGPGEEAQVDFGSGAPIIGPDGKRRKTHVFRIVLSHSRAAYSEVTFRQTTEDFIGCIEGAFVYFGGCPQMLVIDNLRAAVKHPDWFDPELVPKLRSFCQYYGIAILPTKPYMPRHKGKVESSVKYVQNNALKAKKFASLQQQNEYLAHWEATVANTRIHGTTRQHVGRIFREVERPTLRPLPAERFSMFQEAPRKVNRDGHVEVARAYYSAPPEYLGHTVWVRWDARLVRIFNQRFEQIAIHVRCEKGRFSTHAQHLAPEKINGIERGANYLLEKVRRIGSHTHQWAEAMLHARGIEGTRVLQGVIHLSRNHHSEELEKACEKALSHGVFHLRTIRQLIGRQSSQQATFSFLEEHPIIRPMADYAAVVEAALARKNNHTVDPNDTPEVRFERHDWTKALPSSESTPNNDGLDGNHHQGRADMLPPKSSYPLPGCSPAEPDSVSPDTSSVITPFVVDYLKKEKECDE
jgi:transposase